MVHVSMHWSKLGEYNLAILCFALKHASWLHIFIPNQLSSPYRNNCNIMCTDLWDYLVWVLDPKVQDERKIPNWNHCSHLGQVLGFSHVPCFLAANVIHLSPDYVSQNYHLTFDDPFSTDCSNGDDALLDDVCNRFFNSDNNFIATKKNFLLLVNHPQQFDEVWLRNCNTVLVAMSFPIAIALLDTVN